MPTRRGQAIVELTVGATVFITIASFAIFFSELPMAGIGVTEAASSALWDSTAGQMHVLPNDFSGAGRNANRSARSAQARYADGDGRDSAVGPTATQVFTRAGAPRVTCTMNANLPQRGTIVGVPVPNLVPGLQNFDLGDNNGVRCNAESTVSTRSGAQKLSTQDRDGAALRMPSIKLCAVGRPNGLNGPCTGSMAMMTDDWGLASGSGLGGSENASCPGQPFGVPCMGGNMPYWTQVNLVYTASNLALGANQFGNDEHVELLRRMFNGTPSSTPPVPWTVPAGSPTSFQMSFCGEDRGRVGVGVCAGYFRQANPLMQDEESLIGLSAWETTPLTYYPTYGLSYYRRSGCFLGRSCAGGTAANP